MILKIQETMLSSYKILLLSLILLNAVDFQAQNYRIRESNSESITVEFDFTKSFSVRDTILDGGKYQYISGHFSAFRNIGEPWLPTEFLPLAIPFGSHPTFRVISSVEKSFENQLVLPYPDNEGFFGKYDPQNFNKDVYATNKYFPEEVVKLEEPYIVRYARILPAGISPFRYNPVTKKLIFTQKITIQVKFNSAPGIDFKPVNDPTTTSFLKSSVVNYETGKFWMGEVKEVADGPAGTDWYNPLKEYFKIFLSQEGLYRISFSDLVAAGFPSGGNIPVKSLEILTGGSRIPIEVISPADTIFNSGDYIQFIGGPPPATPYTKSNIYNRSNIYWLSYQAEVDTFFYKYARSRPDAGDNILPGFFKVDFYEKDSLYERLGYAINDQRDYWYWDRATGYRGTPTYPFIAQFKPLKNFNTNFPQVRLRVNMHGMTESSCLYGHNVRIVWNNKDLGIAKWSGQSEHTYDRYFVISPDSFNIYPEGNYIQVLADGRVCHPDSSDEIRVNWFEITYYSDNRVAGNNYVVNNSSSQLGLNIFRIWQWTDSTIKIYSPSTKKIIDDPLFLNDADKTILFADSALGVQYYYAVGPNVFLTPDSIRKDISSDLLNTTHAADYLIITHAAFSETAERLKQLRSTNFPDANIPNPRIKIVDVQDIYDQFNFGLMNPFAIQQFIKYVFESWDRPAVTYVALVGDMSYDYRRLRATSRRNYIPSIPHHSYTYGQAASDNGFVCVAGNDILPDINIGRISIESNTEGTTYLNKLEAYPGDPAKKWKENILLMASGLSNEDENRYGFNDASQYLYNEYIATEGYEASRVYRYPNRPEHLAYGGSTYEIRNFFNSGAAVANYYGHGGGYQWDETFLNDDIYLLQNGLRMPVVLSVTCYTAHFDNQDVFGEQFNKVPGKGSIAFFGSSGLTHWDIGKYINNHFFREVFRNKNYMLGPAVLTAKALTPPVGFYANQIALLTLLGDPVLKIALPEDVDFTVRQADIVFSNSSPVLGDSLDIKVRFGNVGIYKSDSVFVELLFSNEDTSGVIGSQKMVGFGNLDSVTFYNWKPISGGLFTVTAKINLSNQISEVDYSDNEASSQLVVFNINNPSILYPADGKRFTNGNINFALSDYGLYLDKTLSYVIEIDTSVSFVHPIISTALLSPVDGILSYQTQLTGGSYFWRARIFDGENFGKWTPTRSFSIGDSAKSGYILSGDQLQLFNRENINFSHGNGTLSLNVDLLPPKPQINRLIKEFNLDSTISYNMGLSCLATDGKYLYVANLWYWMITLYGDSTGRTKIFKFGTGNDGTVEGEYYGEIPGFLHRIGDQMAYHSDGFLYLPISDPYTLLRVNPETGQTDSVTIPAGLLDKSTGKVQAGSFYITSDSQYVYNVATRDSLERNRYTIRVYDPANNWSLVAEHYYENLSSFVGFVNFFVADGYFYPYENYVSGYLRRIRISDGYFDLEWIPWFVDDIFQHIRYYAWAYDWKNNQIYASVYRPGTPRIGRIGRYPARYLDAAGTIVSPDIGPANRYKSLSFKLDQGTGTTTFRPFLFGYNKNARTWDTLAAGFSTPLDLTQFNPSVYTLLRVQATITDSSYSQVNPLKVSEMHLDYDGLQEILLRKETFTFSPDSLLQGLDINLQMKVFNYGDVVSDTVSVKFYLNDDDIPFHTAGILIPGNGETPISTSINTSPMIFEQKVRAVAEVKTPEYYTFNNIINQKFFVARDSINPQFKITFDGKEIINGDIVSKRPEIFISLQDNSPLPLDTTLFTLIFDNIPMSYYRDKIDFDYIPYPNSEAQLTWKPTLSKGRHTLDILAKDASGNFFDSTYLRTVFFVYDVDDIDIVYNYPNPFASGTYFTFELRGTNTPEEIKVRVYTVAGRLIRELKFDKSMYDINFNKIYWDGRDQDGDPIANGVYIYKLISKFPDKTKTITKKLVKMD